MKAKIPIKNIFYLLSYAWEMVEWGDERNLSEEAFSDSENLFGKLFELSFSWLSRKGLYRTYLTDVDETRSIRGKVLLSESVKSGALLKGQAFCQTDELTYNNIYNQVLKTSLSLLLRVNGLSRELRKTLEHSHSVLGAIDEIGLSELVFKKLNYNRNNRHYRFIMELCHLFFKSSNLSDETGVVKVRDFFDEITMSALFEKFILNFYRIEAKGIFKVSARKFKWEEVSGDEDFLKRLPSLNTDITLWNETASFIIETKYYQVALTSQFEGQKYIRSHLSQLKEYLREGERDLGSKPKGILLYPTVEYAISDSGSISGYELSIRTIDLSQPFDIIKNNLLEMIGIAPKQIKIA